MKTDSASVRCELFEEPSLEFASSRLHLCPKRGITIFGPRSLDMGKRHPDIIRVGFVGTGETIDAAVRWLELCADGVEGDKANFRFPGFKQDRGFFSGLPAGLGNGTCYVGISFHQLLGSKNSGYFTGLAQAFDEQGNGLVLRGQDFVWDTSKHGNSAHMPAPIAEELVSRVLKRYRDELKQSPRRVVIHKTTEYWPDERAGLQSALKGVDQFDLVAVRPTEDIRLFRDALYPILRGSHVSLGDMHLLYTTGYISALQAFPHGHVPLPLKLTDHLGDSSISTVLRELMVLTKMNWNSANFGGLLPITLRFSKLVGEIMKEIPNGVEPLPQFKYYM